VVVGDCFRLGPVGDRQSDADGTGLVDHVLALGAADLVTSVGAIYQLRRVLKPGLSDRCHRVGDATSSGWYVCSGPPFRPQTIPDALANNAGEIMVNPSDRDQSACPQLRPSDIHSVPIGPRSTARIPSDQDCGTVDQDSGTGRESEGRGGISSTRLVMRRSSVRVRPRAPVPCHESWPARPGAPFLSSTITSR